jgi:hypothetical protein
MTPTPTLAFELIRQMETRIERQSALIERLKQAGQDTSGAVYRLGLLHRALDEMRIQLGQLSPTPLDAKRPSESPLAAFLSKRQAE